MYNEDLKRRFINEYAGKLKTANFVESVFNSLDKYETAWGADLCTMKGDELQIAVDESVGLRSKTQWMYLTIFKEYVKWCLAMNVPGARDDMLKINSIGVSRVKRQMVSGPLHLQRYMDSIFDKESDETIDNIYRCYFWMAFGGINEEDALLIKNEDINLSESSIRYRETTVPIYREALPAFRNAVTLTSFLYKNANYANPIRRDRIQGDEIMRGVRSTPKIHTMRRMISQRGAAAIERGAADTQLSFSRIKMSGMFYRAYERERAGYRLTFKEEVLDTMRDKEYTLSGRETIVHKQNRLEREFIKDYKRWKLAFLI